MRAEVDRLLCGRLGVTQGGRAVVGRLGVVGQSCRGDGTAVFTQERCEDSPVQGEQARRGIAPRTASRASSCRKASTLPSARSSPDST